LAGDQIHSNWQKFLLGNLEMRFLVKLPKIPNLERKELGPTKFLSQFDQLLLIYDDKPQSINSRIKNKESANDEDCWSAGNDIVQGVSMVSGTIEYMNNTESKVKDVAIDNFGYIRAHSAQDIDWCRQALGIGISRNILSMARLELRQEGFLSKLFFPRKLVHSNYFVDGDGERIYVIVNEILVVFDLATEKFAVFGIKEAGIVGVSVLNTTLVLIRNDRDRMALEVGFVDVEDLTLNSVWEKSVNLGVSPDNYITCSWTVLDVKYIEEAPKLVKEPGLVTIVFGQESFALFELSNLQMLQIKLEKHRIDEAIAISKSLNDETILKSIFLATKSLNLLPDILDLDWLIEQALTQTSLELIKTCVDRMDLSPSLVEDAVVRFLDTMDEKDDIIVLFCKRIELLKRYDLISTFNFLNEKLLLKGEDLDSLRQNFCSKKVEELAACYAAEGDIKTLTAFLNRFALGGCRLSLLDLVPMSVEVSEYQHLLPKFVSVNDELVVKALSVAKLHKQDWSDSDSFQEFYMMLVESSIPFEIHPEPIPRIKDWALCRISKYCNFGMIDFATEFNRILKSGGLDLQIDYDLEICQLLDFTLDDLKTRDTMEVLNCVLKAEFSNSILEIIEYLGRKINLKTTELTNLLLTETFKDMQLFMLAQSVLDPAAPSWFSMRDMIDLGYKEIGSSDIWEKIFVVWDIGLEDEWMDSESDLLEKTREKIKKFQLHSLMKQTFKKFGIEKSLDYFKQFDGSNFPIDELFRNELRFDIEIASSDLAESFLAIGVAPYMVYKCIVGSLLQKSCYMEAQKFIYSEAFDFSAAIADDLIFPLALKRFLDSDGDKNGLMGEALKW
jgi:hypothetical protein